MQSLVSRAKFSNATQIDGNTGKLRLDKRYK